MENRISLLTHTICLINLSRCSRSLIVYRLQIFVNNLSSALCKYFWESSRNVYSWRITNNQFILTSLRNNNFIYWFRCFGVCINTSKRSRAFAFAIENKLFSSIIHLMSMLLEKANLLVVTIVNHFRWMFSK